MDKELRILERQAAVEPSLLMPLLYAAARSGRLNCYSEHLPAYFASLSSDELSRYIGPSNSLQKFSSRLGLPSKEEAQKARREIIAFHLTHPGSGNFSTLGTAKLEIALYTVRILFAEKLLNKCLIITVPARTESIETDILRLLPDHKNQIRVITYSRSWRKEEELLAENYPIVICDEASRIINPQSKQSRTAYRLGDQAIYRMALTGVPIRNSWDDIFGMMRFIEPNVFGKSRRYFRRKYFTWDNTAILKRILKYGVEEEILKLIEPHYIKWW